MGGFAPYSDDDLLQPRRPYLPWTTPTGPRGNMMDRFQDPVPLPGAPMDMAKTAQPAAPPYPGPGRPDLAPAVSIANGGSTPGSMGPAQMNQPSAAAPSPAMPQVQPPQDMQPAFTLPSRREPIQDVLDNDVTATPRPARPTAQFQPPHLSKARTAAGLALSFMSPTMGSYVLNQPWRRAEADYGNQLQRQHEYDVTQFNEPKVEAETQEATARAGMMQENVPVVGPGGQTFLIPKNALGRYLSSQVGAESRQNVAQTNAASRKEVAQIHEGTPIPVDEVTANLAGFPELAGVAVGKGTWGNINKALTARGYRLEDLGEEGMWLLDRAGNRLKKVSDEGPSVARARAYNNTKNVTVADDEGNVTYDTAGHARATGARSPQSVLTKTQVTMARAATSGKIGDELTSFRTAIDHADMLKQAATALNNGTMRTMTGLKNRWQTEFGVPAPNTFEAIADVYANEVAKAVSAGHITNQEISKKQITLPANASPQQISDVLNAYQGLMRSKVKQRKTQVQAGMQGQPAYENEPAPDSHVFSTAAWQKANPQGDVNKAAAAARRQGFKVVP
jgi:uncharacterized protein YdbL (DUF1318 family)